MMPPIRAYLVGEKSGVLLFSVISISLAHDEDEIKMLQMLVNVLFQKTPDCIHRATCTT
jgi:hypothetical protein